MSEATEQQVIIEWCEWNKVPIFAIPNGGKRNAKEAYFMKKSGVKSGVPDLFVPVPTGDYAGLFIELKVGKNKPTENQKHWIDLLLAQGYSVCVCYGAQQAIELIRGYIE